MRNLILLGISLILLVEFRPVRNKDESVLPQGLCALRAAVKGTGVSESANGEGGVSWASWCLGFRSGLALAVVSPTLPDDRVKLRGQPPMKLSK
jgi:hypothetical protein